MAKNCQASLSLSRQRPRICAVIVTFHPDPLVGDRLQAISCECDQVIVVDNGSSSESLKAIQDAIPQVDLLPQPANIGLAEALNLGLRRALASGFHWAITFDQDSTPAAGLAEALWATHMKFPSTAIVAPRIAEATTAPGDYRWVCKSKKWPIFFERVRCQDHDLSDVTNVITSGSLMDLTVWSNLGGFESKFFIDYIDVEYCLRVARAGRSIAVSSRATMNHQLGSRRRVDLFRHDFRPTFHQPFRHYYIARNRVLVWRRYGISEPHWALFDLCYAAYNMVRVIIFENNRWKKVKAFALGLFDGLRDKYGPLADGRL